MDKSKVARFLVHPVKHQQAPTQCIAVCGTGRQMDGPI